MNPNQFKMENYPSRTIDYVNWEAQGWEGERFNPKAYSGSMNFAKPGLFSVSATLINVQWIPPQFYQVNRFAVNISGQRIVQMNLINFKITVAQWIRARPFMSIKSQNQNQFAPL